MLKKIVLLTLMAINGFACMPQDHLYIVPVSSSRFDFGDVYNAYDITLDMQIYREISDRAWTRIYFGLGGRFINDYWEPIFGLGFGVGYNLGNFYGSLDFKPTFSYTGNGHQVYGDEFAFRLMPKVGIGYNWFISDCTALFVETGFYKELNIICTRKDLNIDSFGIYLNFGFKFKHV